MGLWDVGDFRPDSEYLIFRTLSDTSVDLRYTFAVNATAQMRSLMALVRFGEAAFSLCRSIMNDVLSLAARPSIFRALD